MRSSYSHQISLRHYVRSHQKFKSLATEVNFNRPGEIYLPFVELRSTSFSYARFERQEGVYDSFIMISYLPWRPSVYEGNLSTQRSNQGCLPRQLQTFNNNRLHLLGGLPLSLSRANPSGPRRTRSKRIYSIHTNTRTMTLRIIAPTSISIKSNRQSQNVMTTLSTTVSKKELPGTHRQSLKKID